MMKSTVHLCLAFLLLVVTALEARHKTMDNQEDKTINAEDTKAENGEAVNLPVSGSVADKTIAEKAADNSTAKLVEANNAATVEVDVGKMIIPTEDGGSQQSATLVKTMDSQESTTSETEVTIAEKVADGSKQMVEMSDIEMETQEGTAEQCATLSIGNQESTEIEMTAEKATAVQPAVVVKEEPVNTDMQSAEDFTRRSSDFPTVPRIRVKQENQKSFQEQVAAEQAMESKAVVQINNSALSLLSQYISSDSESNITDSEEELPRKNAPAGRRDSISSDDDVQVIPNTESYRVHDGPVIVSDTETTATGMDDSEDEISAEEDAPRVAPPIKTKGEVLPTELPPIEDLQISVPEAECKPIGHVESIVAQIVIVQSYAGVELLNLETVLFLEKGKRALGKIFDVIGQVTAPMYCVLFNNRQDVIRKGISVGMPVYCAPQTEHTSFIILSDLMRDKGSDASWLDDNEAPDHVLDYSDDEQERRARRRRGSCSSSGRNSPDGGHPSYQPYQVHQPYQPHQHHQRRGQGRGGGYRGRQGHSWHTNVPVQQQQQQPQPQIVINPFAFIAGVPPPPPPPPPPGSDNN